jgi:hypothetical protein
VLFRLGCEYLQAAKIVRPGVISLMDVSPPSGRTR